MANVFEPTFDEEGDAGGLHYRRARLAAQAGARHLGLSLWELPPGASSPFHYHVQNEELAIVLSGTLSLRTGAGDRRLLHEGEVVAFPRGERGAHELRNDGNDAARVLLVSEMNAPNVSVYPDENLVGVYDAPLRDERRFGALFKVDEAVSDYGGGRAKIVPPAEPGQPS